ncbi:cache domain-containing protein, partial [Caminibacter pacificus]
MAKTEKLKNRILKLNYLSIIGVVVVFSILSFASVYYVLNMSLQRDIEFTKQEYINSKKATIKNQVDNLINYINYISKTETQKKLERLKQDVEFLSDVLKNIPLEKLPMFFNRYISEHSFYKVIVRENNKVIFHHGNLPEELFDYKPIGKIDVFIKNKKYYIFAKEVKINNRHYTIILGLAQQDIDKMVQKKVINLVHTMQFVFNNGYISIIKIENFNGGRKFAKFVAYPKNPDWEGLYLNDDKKDAKGIE